MVRRAVPGTTTIATVLTDLPLHESAVVPLGKWEAQEANVAQVKT